MTVIHTQMIRILEDSLREIRYQQQRYKTRLDELEREEDMTLLTLQELRKQRDAEGDAN